MKTTANRSYNSSTPVQGSNATSGITNPVQGSIVPSNTTSNISNPVQGSNATSGISNPVQIATLLLVYQIQ
jgi:hypothetical protein